MNDYDYAKQAETSRGTTGDPLDDTETQAQFDERARARKAEDERLEAQVVYNGFTLAQLRAAFTAVQDEDNWKNPIDAFIDNADVDVTRAAIIFFAGSVMDVVSHAAGRCRIKAPGYYLSIGA